MSTVSNCGDCTYYERDTSDVTALLKKKDRGACRRLPPKGYHEWPVVNADEWCGEFELAPPEDDRRDD